MKNRSLTLILILASGLQFAEARRTHKGNTEAKGAEITPGQFHAITVPKSYVRLQVETEQYGQDAPYDVEDDNGLQSFFNRGEFKEWTTSIIARYGLTEQIEIGLKVPFVDAEFNLDSSDKTGLLAKQQESALGNIGLLAAFTQSWNDGSDNFLLSGQLGLQTDQHDNPFFEVGGNANVVAVMEHYWDRVGVLGGFSTSLFAENDYEGEWVQTVFGGFGLEPFNKAYLSGQLVDEEGNKRIEGSAEYILTERSSIEVFGGVDVDSEVDAYYFGLSLNVVHGNNYGSVAPPAKPVQTR